MKYKLTAQRIAKILRDTGMKQQELADKSGVSKYNISHFVNGYNKPGNLNAAAISRVTGYNPLWIMGFDVPEKEPLTKPSARGLTLDEEEVLRAYRRADELSRAMVQRTLGIEKKKESAKQSS